LYFYKFHRVALVNTVDFPFFCGAFNLKSNFLYPSVFSLL
jgi:hypothetical protein